MKYLTALASKGVPSWNLTPLRSLKVQVSPSFDDVHDSASAGSICIFVLNRTRLSYIIRFTCSPGFDCVFCGSRLSGSEPAANVSAPPATGACAPADPAATRPPIARSPTSQSDAICLIAHLLSDRVSTMLPGRRAGESVQMAAKSTGARSVRVPRTSSYFYCLVLPGSESRCDCGL